jgi:hypothetical protein
MTAAARGRLDGRTKEAQLLKTHRAELIQHCGGNPSPVQRALIEQACQIKLRLFKMDQKFAKSGGMTEHDTAHYLAWSNSYTRTVSRLGLTNPDEKPDPLDNLRRHLGRRVKETT